MPNTVQNFYQLLSVAPTATAEEIKRAFRTEIARYHPDKVQHLGKEFQQMAASRAAALTEAYRTLTNAELRAEYDRQYLGSDITAGPAVDSPPSSPASQAPPRPPSPEPPPSNAHGASAPPPRFASERRDRDDFVRKATLERVRQALAAELGTVELHTTRGLDLDCTVSSKKLFSRTSQRFAVKFVRRVDKPAIQDAWGAAQKAGVPVCVFVMGNDLAPVGELSAAISDLRRRARGAGTVAIIPVDLRDWSAHLPADVPPVCRNLLNRLRDAAFTL